LISPPPTDNNPCQIKRSEGRDPIPSGNVLREAGRALRERAERA
jgi:hypothetical protein